MAAASPTELKQSTGVTLRVGPFLDASDGVTEEEGLTPAFRLSKNNGAFAARNDATAPTHDSDGWYTCVLDATDTNTLGRLLLNSQDPANHVPVWHEFLVVPDQTLAMPVSHMHGGFRTQSTAGQIVVGPFISLSTGLPLTSLTVGDIDCGVIKQGAPPTDTSITLTASGGNNDMVHLGAGYFRVEITATDVGTLGLATFYFQDPDVFRPIDITVTVVDANVGGVLLSTDVLDTSTVQCLGTAVTAATAGFMNVNMHYIKNNINAPTYLAAALATSPDRIKSDLVYLDGSSAAADNMLADYDGTGYAGGTIVKKADVTKISGDGTAPDVLEDMLIESTPTGTVDDTSFSPTTLDFETSITEATADHYNGSRMRFITGANAGQGRVIADYVLTGGRGDFNFAGDPWTDAPANGDAFQIDP